MECLVYRTVKQGIVSDTYIQQVVSFVFQQEKRSGNISVHLIGDTRMTRLNMIYRGKQNTTDVLSFAAIEDDDHVVFPHQETEWGDIFISIPQIKRQAKQFSVTHKQELTRMLVHGVLHIFGYDHITKKDAEKMFPKQEQYVRLCLPKK